MIGRAFVFINFKQAAHLGHIGWGFKLDGYDRYLFGSTDHLIHHEMHDLMAWLRYASVPVGADVDYWSQEGTLSTMMDIMKSGNHIRYHHYKAFPVQNAKPKDAMQAAAASGAGGWHVLQNNCVHQTYNLLNTYGAELPEPPPLIRGIGLIPRVWFNNIKGELGELRPPSTPGL
ncbi:MAG TPA: hypothetical protein EYN91_23820 [Candidatus Melainabacteria bacterium]|nr:hypothetical protein [Candidatus Melainabacteria bacterium]HIN64251.1 hypothetical protein [Candidatus Obscuribacterales bacterium]